MAKAFARRVATRMSNLSRLTNRRNIYSRQIRTDRTPTYYSGSAARSLRNLLGDALPLTIAIDPSVGETIGPIEGFAVFAGPLLERVTDRNHRARSIDVHFQTFNAGRRISI